MNFVEGICSMMTLLLIGGVSLPIPAAVLGLILILGRIIYAVGYFQGGPNSRVAGVLMAHIGELGLFGLAVYSSIDFIQS